jgi:hypothetical protein
MRVLSEFLVLAVLAGTAFARCYSSNERQESWNNQKDATSSVKSACKILAGDYRINVGRTLCLSGLSGTSQKYDFVAVMDQDPEKKGTYKLEADECEERFETNVKSCERGGQTNNKQMIFTLVFDLRIDECKETNNQCSLTPSRGRCQ